MIMTNELEGLKAKCNKQLEKILELETENKKLEEQHLTDLQTITQLKEQLSFSANIQQIGKSELPEEGQNALILNTFIKILKKIKQDKAFLYYKNQTKNSDLFYKIEKGLFESYVRDETTMECGEFIRSCAQFSFFKKDRDGKCLFNSSMGRLYYINKILVEVA